ncbi:hypothetical protein BXT92_21040 [Klebsiella pneumoniae]|nr:hypothetical protein BXT92_21040 [Klebsiella pneumoniae]
MEIIFDPSLIALKQNISRAEEAIELAGSLLARRQICSAEYVNEMLTVYEDFGAAIVIDDGIAMPHARPEKGALQTGFSLVTTATPISFGHDEFDPVSVVIAIAGADADKTNGVVIMLVIRTVCGNGIGSSLMAANNVKKICDELGIKADVASVDFANAVGEKADLYVTIKELANQFPAHCHVAIIRSYVHKAKIAEDITDALMKIAATHS